MVKIPVVTLSVWLVTNSSDSNMKIDLHVFNSYIQKHRIMIIKYVQCIAELPLVPLPYQYCELQDEMEVTPVKIDIF